MATYVRDFTVKTSSNGNAAVSDDENTSLAADDDALVMQGSKLMLKRGDGSTDTVTISSGNDDAIAMAMVLGG